MTYHSLFKSILPLCTGLDSIVTQCNVKQQGCLAGLHSYISWQSWCWAVTVVNCLPSSWHCPGFGVASLKLALFPNLAQTLRSHYWYDIQHLATGLCTIAVHGMFDQYVLMTLHPPTGHCTGHLRYSLHCHCLPSFLTTNIGGVGGDHYNDTLSIIGTSATSCITWCIAWWPFSIIYF